APAIKAELGGSTAASITCAAIVTVFLAFTPGTHGSYHGLPNRPPRWTTTRQKPTYREVCSE
ncbi:MAG TPA: hypothetical protein VGK57_12230, partial [Candidatus Binatia bacterium]